MTALTVACGGRDVSKHDATILKHLSRTSADAEKAMQGLTHLHEVQENIPPRIPVVKALVEAGADVNGNFTSSTSSTTTASTYKKTTTPLMCAAELGHSDVVRCLLEAGADVNAQDATGGTALLKAAALGRTECIEILVNQPGVEINCVDKNGVSAVLAAVAAGQVESLWTLLAAGGDPNVGVRRVDGCSALHIAAASGRADVVTALMALNADVNAVNIKEETPVHLAAQLGRTEAVAVLVKNQKAVDSLSKTDYRGWTPLMAALERGHVDVAIVLLDSKKDVGVNVADRKDGMTAMGLALALGQPGECVIYRLMVAGADPYVLAGKQAPQIFQTGSSSSVVSVEPIAVAEIVEGPLPAVVALAEGVSYGMGADEVIPQFL
jgi:ankyrin repeat protein